MRAARDRRTSEGARVPQKLSARRTHATPDLRWNHHHSTSRTTKPAQTSTHQRERSALGTAVVAATVSWAEDAGAGGGGFGETTLFERGLDDIGDEDGEADAVGEGAAVGVEKEAAMGGGATGGSAEKMRD